MGLTPSLTRRMAFWGLMGLTLLMYAPTLGHFPVADSWVFLEPKSLAETFGYFTRSVIPDEWNALWFRPLPMFTFWLDTVVWPDTVWGPHLINILLHLINTALIWRLASAFQAPDTDRSLLPPFAAGLVYAVHPLTVGSVAWIAARFDVMCVTMGLAALTQWFAWSVRKRTGSLVWCLILLACAILSKEQGIVFSGVVGFSALHGAYTTPARRRAFIGAAGSVTTLVAVYFAYRITLFQGLGGYLESQQTLSLTTPIGFLAALLFPYPNPAPQWRLSALPVLTTLVLGLLAVLLVRSPRIKTHQPSHFTLITAGALLVMGLASTGPHAGLQFMDILGHIESRFVLIGLAGLALTIGWLLTALVKTDRARLGTIIILSIWSVSALWRSDIQLAAWRSAGDTARHIVTITATELPDPPRNANLYFFSIPSYSEQNAYIFGIGLKEAIRRQYPGRDDIIIHPHAIREDIVAVDPVRDGIFAFNRDTWRLEHLIPQRR